MSTHIRVRIETKKMLDKMKSKYESYDSVIRRLIEAKPRFILDKNDREKMLKISEAWRLTYVFDEYVRGERVIYARFEPKKK